MPQRKNTPKQKGWREMEILKLVKERCLLCKAWRKANQLEKEGLKALWDQLRARLANLRRAEDLEGVGKTRHVQASSITPSSMVKICWRRNLESSWPLHRSWRTTLKNSLVTATEISPSGHQGMCPILQNLHPSLILVLYCSRMFRSKEQIFLVNELNRTTS